MGKFNHRFSEQPLFWHEYSYRILAYCAYRRYFTPEELTALWEKEFAFLGLVEEHNEREGMWYSLMRRRH